MICVVCSTPLTYNVHQPPPYRSANLLALLPTPPKNHESHLDLFMLGLCWGMSLPSKALSWPLSWQTQKEFFRPSLALDYLVLSLSLFPYIYREYITIYNCINFEITHTTPAPRNRKQTNKHTIKQTNKQSTNQQKQTINQT